MKIQFIFALSCTIISSYAYTCSPVPPPQYIIVYGAAAVLYKECCDKRAETISDDTTNFKVIHDFYASDSKRVYYQGKELKGAIPSSFQFLGGISSISFTDGYSKDSEHVYFEGEPIEEADSHSFELIKNSRGYAKDKQYLYFRGIHIKNINVATIQHLESNYWADGHKLYFLKLNEVDPKAILLNQNFDGKFKLLNKYFVTNVGVFLDGIKTAYDPVTVSVLGAKTIMDSCNGEHFENLLLTDKNGTYLDNKKLPFQLKTFEGYPGLFQSNRNILYAFSNNQKGLVQLGLTKQLKNY